MVNTQSGTDVGAGISFGPTVEGTLDTDDDTIPGATSLVTPCTELFTRTRVSGLHIPRTLRSGDSGIARLGGAASLNKFNYLTIDLWTPRGIP